LAIAALRASVGDEDFFNILREWPQEFEGKAVTTKDFVDFAGETANVDLDSWAGSWLYGSSKPAAWPAKITENGDTVTPTVTLDGGSTVTLPPLKAGEPFGTLPAPTKTGYVFAGWYVDNVKVTPGSIVPSTPFTLVAKWTKVGAASIKGAKVAAVKDQVYTGKAKKPQLKVTLAGKALVANTDYTVAYTNNIKIGKATVTVTGKGKYKDAVKAAFKIVPKAVSVKSLKAGKKKFTLKWKKATGITKYQVRYKLKAAKSWKTVSIAAKATSKAVGKLKKGKKYQVQIRAYKTVGGVKYLSAWSKVKTVKVK
jgi:uncharacterized repeat protein (TIGR02543 family)